MSLDKLKKELKAHDDAFLNSTLAYGIYTGREWTINSEAKSIYQIEEANAHNTQYPTDRIDAIKSLVEPLSADNSMHSETDEDFEGEALSEQEVIEKAARDEAIKDYMRTSFTHKIDLSSFVSTTNNSTLDISSVPEKIEPMDRKTANEAYLKIFHTSTFNKVRLDMDEEFNFESDKYGFVTDVRYSNGMYEALEGLAKAAVFKSQNEDGTINLHLTFRGTDTLARPIKEFFKKAYLDMSAYYDAFKPLENAVIAYANDPKNKVSSVHVSGHSLGGSMVQEFFKSSEIAAIKAELKGFTYGAPGSSKNLFYSTLPGIYHAVKHGKFLNLVTSFFEPVADMIMAISGKDERITQFKHSGDLIPKISIPLYSSSGNTIYLKDVASKEVKDNFILQQNEEAQALIEHSKVKLPFFKQLIYNNLVRANNQLDKMKKAFTFKYHDMLRYNLNLEHAIQKIKMENPELKSCFLTPHMDNFATLKARFVTEPNLPSELPDGFKNTVSELEQRGLKSLIQKIRDRAGFGENNNPSSGLVI